MISSQRHSLCWTRCAAAAVGRWLLIFDNADEPRDLKPYLPARAQVLITSRNPS
jgi:hypothetical protein